MRKFIILLLLSTALFGVHLNVKSGMVGAHTEMVMDDTIDPLNTELHGDITMNDGDFLSIRGNLWIDMDLFISDEPSRDDNMDETNDIIKFPKSKYIISSVTKMQKKDMYVIHGTLDYHGILHTFIFDAEILQKNEELVINATSSLLLSDYNIEAPCMVFICIRNKIDIFAQAVLVK